MSEEEVLNELVEEIRKIRRRIVHFTIAYIVFWTITIFLMHVFHTNFGI